MLIISLAFLIKNLRRTTDTCGFQELQQVQSTLYYLKKINLVILNFKTRPCDVIARRSSCDLSTIINFPSYYFSLVAVTSAPLFSTSVLVCLTYVLVFFLSTIFYTPVLAFLTSVLTIFTFVLTIFTFVLTTFTFVLTIFSSVLTIFTSVLVAIKLPPVTMALLLMMVSILI